ncbi:tRNA 2-selenouridine(34) synthase MnmH [uncultured Rikenella sp.]|uniref:tRNA 2-selenouridine(34) synthase MnmH n=1 Tax=uncultured Rikenella sp. TaxID=368003 RepID=UPI00260BE5BB|nr:tRNA 2-selenouridine(34) synthase MnmH [uncultured Rikenella sp.]
MRETLSAEAFLSESIRGIMIDVRSPSEYQAGHIPGAHSLPLFTDAERAEVGTLYTRVGKNEAIERGLAIVGPKMARFVQTARKQAAGKTLYVYCWRGGMRSGSMAWLFRTAGMSAVVLEGGYRAYRRLFAPLLAAKPWQFFILGGFTGCGKSDVLRAMARKGEQVLDLEALANHKGSVFGALGQEEQPTTEEFINRIHASLRRFDPAQPVWIEGESQTIGHVVVPVELYRMMQSAPLVLFSLDPEARLQRLVREYGAFSTEELAAAFAKIAKRLGDGYPRALQSLEAGDTAGAARIAMHYYDKCYTRSIGKENHSFREFFMPEDDPERAAELLIEKFRKIK